MSFLPHGRPRALSWYGSFAASLTAHAGIVSFVLFSGIVVLTPRPPEPEDTPEITVSLEILDANIVEEMEPVDDANLVPEDAEVTEPDALDAETPDDLAALSPDDQDLLAPEDDSLLTPDEDDTLAPEPELAEPDVPEPDVLEPEPLEPDVLEPEPLEPEVAEPEVIEPEPIEPEVAEPEVVEPEPIAPELAEVLPEVIDEPVLEPEEIVEPEPEIAQPEEVADVPEVPEPTPPPAPEPEAPLAIDDLSPIDDTVLNPLASGGSGEAPVQDDVLAVIAPEPDQPEAPILQPESAEEITPTVLPEPDTDLPEPEIVDEGTEIAALPEVIEETPIPDGVDDAPVPDLVEETPEPAAPAPPPAPVREPIANPSASDVAIAQLLRRIRATPQEQCTLALPRRIAGDQPVGLAMIGAREDQLDAAATAILDGLDFAPVQSRELIDPRQCATLDALRQSESYPANRIGLSIDIQTLASGDVLTGRVVGAEGLFVTLLLVDDNGVVQDLAQFVTLDGSTPIFEVPVARAGPSRATRQMLLAIGTADTPLNLSERIGQEAQEVFGPIPSDTLNSMVFGLATFDVQ